MIDEQLNSDHAHNPIPGDLWVEMLCCICIVLDATENEVTFCKSKIDVDSNHWTWDLENVDTLTKEQFNAWLAYTNIDGYWAHVMPGKHLWAVEEYNKNTTVDIQITKQI